MRIGPLVALACLVFPAQAQEEPPSIFGEEVDVRVINVEVVVTDRQGNRVTDLKPGDFRLEVDGKPVAIEYFTEIHEGQAVAAPPSAFGPLPSEPVARVPTLEPGAAVGTQYLLFIDDYFLVAAQRNDVLRALKKDLEVMGPADGMSVLAWDGGRIRRLADWTGSRSRLEQAIDEAMARPTHGMERAAEFQRFLQEDQFVKNSTGDLDFLYGSKDTERRFAFSELTLQEKAFGMGLASQIETSVSAAVSAMRGSAPPAGRKVLVLLGGGWPFSLQSYIRRSGPAVLSHALPSGEELYRPLSRTANLLGYTIYPVDVPGVSSLAADASVNPMEGRESVIMGMAATSDKPNAALQETDFGKQGEMPSQLTDTKSVIEQELQGSLEFLAQETGGKSLINSNRTLALAKVGADTRSYYWLGFSPAWQKNDKSHRIRVEPLRSGLTARSRSDFLDLSKQAEVAMKLESALLFGGDVAGSERMSFVVGTPVRARKGKGVEIPVSLAIPVSALTVLPVGGKYAAELELRFAATDERGNPSDIPALPVRLSSSQPPPTNGVVRYDTRIVLRGKATRLVAAVYDRASGKIAAAEADLSPVQGPAR